MRKNLLKSLITATFGFAICAISVAQSTLLNQVKPSGSEFWGYVNTKGEEVITAQYSKCFAFSKDGLAVVVDPRTKLLGFINVKGEMLPTEVADFKLISFFGFETEGFSEGLVAIKLGKKWGYMNTSGKIAIPVKYDGATSFNSGCAVVKNGDIYLLVNKKGEEIAINMQGLTDLKAFNEGLAIFKNSDKLFGFLGTDGKVAIEAKFNGVGYFTNGLAWAKSSTGLFGYINKKGEWVIKPQFTSGKDYDAESGLARIKSEDNWGYVNKAGEVMRVPDAESWGDFSNGLAEGKRLKLCGFYNSKGVWVIEPKFEDTRAFKNGFASVKLNGKWGVINKEGKFIIDPIFSSIKDFEITK